MNKPLTDFASIAAENGLKSFELWRNYENSEQKYRARARHRYNIVHALNIENLEQNAIAAKYKVSLEQINKYNSMVHGYEQHDWLPALLGKGWAGIRLFEKPSPSTDFAAALTELVAAIDVIIQGKLDQDAGDSGYLTQQAIAYFELAEILRKSRTIAIKLNEVTL